tara:strand:- start:235 stop:519 length:285 start_codon:yes stop_codon:yes gene_type:complete
MAKQEEVIDLAPTVEKITDEQLKDLQGLIGQINNAQLSIGQLETQKAGVLQGVGELQGKLKSMQDELEKEYGKVSVNIQDGTFKAIEDEADKED